MNIFLYKNNSEPNKIGKTLTNEIHLTGSLKEESNVVNPSILIDIENPSAYNYAYIPEFNRFYFIKEFVCVRNHLWRIVLISDPLESFKNEILSNSVIISGTETTGSFTYLSGDVWKSSVKENTDIVQFPNGLLNTGEFILITAGG